MYYIVRLSSLILFAFEKLLVCDHSNDDEIVIAIGFKEPKPKNGFMEGDQ